MRLRTAVAATTVAALGVAGAGYGSWSSGSALSVQKRADLYSIDQIEATWHRAASRKNLDLMMTLWAPNATFTLGGKTYKGKPAIREVLSKAGPFQPQNHWISETPAYKIRTTVSGNKGTLYFECHYVDVDTGKVAVVVGADQDVQKIRGKWLITKLIGSSPTLAP
jgi:hypothetical protein